MDTSLLQQLTGVHAPSGEEGPMKEFLLKYIEENKRNWKQEPKVLTDENEFQDSLLLIFGTPRTAIFAHMDSIGFMVKNDKELVKIGGPKTEDGFVLVGEDSKGPVECKLQVTKEEDENGKMFKKLGYESERAIDRGTSLTFKQDFRKEGEYVQSCYLDDRLGVYNTLKVAETLENGAIAFSCWEEHGGGSVEILSRHLFETYGVRQALVSDITWITEDVHAGLGTAISIRDSSIPRRKFIDQVLAHARDSGIPFQIEVEGAGGSDGKYLQSSPYPFNWCFIGAAEDHVHSPDEKVHKKDVESMTGIYKWLMERL